MSKAYVPRIAQLDVKYIDNEISTIVLDKLTSAFSLVGQKFLVKFEPELNGIINLVLHYFHLKERNQTLGQSLLNIKYDNLKLKMLNYYTFTIHFCCWLKKRQTAVLFFLKCQHFKEKLLNLLLYLETAYQILEVLNLLIFLTSGQYPSILERLFKLKMVPCSNSGNRIVCYNYFTRELLWSSYTDLLSFVLPLITIDHFHNFIRMLLPKFSSDSMETKPNEQGSNGRVDIDLWCMFCKKKSVLPHTFGCKHSACYYCIYSTLAITSSFKCLLCNIEIQNTSVLPLAINVNN